MKPYPAIQPFYPVVPTAAWVERLVKAGARLVQLRYKDGDSAAARREIEAALAVCRPAQACLVVNDFWELAIDAGASYIHLGQTDLDGADLPAIRRAAIRIGVSTHDHAELERGLSCDPDYVALGPIYPTTLKEMPWAPQGLDRITEWKRLVGSRPLVAIGGITIERGPGCFRAGADSIAVVSDVTQNADPEARTQAWLELAQRGAS